MIPLHLATSNAHKVHEYQALLAPFIVVPVHAELTEIQGSAEEIVRHKARQAYEQVRAPVIVDDAGLFVHAWKTLPGVYVKEFLASVGKEGIVRMLDAYSDKRATAQCWIGYCDEHGTYTFSGSAEGTIVEPRGTSNFGDKGWDAIFQPTGSQRTWGEMTLDEKGRESHRVRAINELKKFLQRHTSPMP